MTKVNCKCGQIAMFPDIHSIPYICPDCQPSPKPGEHKFTVELTQTREYTTSIDVFAIDEKEAEKKAMESEDELDWDEYEIETDTSVSYIYMREE